MSSKNRTNWRINPRRNSIPRRGTVLEPMVFLARPLYVGLFKDLRLCEEIRYLKRSGLWRVRTVNRIPLNARPEVSSNAPRRRLSRIGRPHNGSYGGDRRLSFQNHHHGGAGAYEICQALKKRALAVDVIEFFGTLPVQAHHAQTTDPESYFLETANDFTDLPASDRIWFHNSECPLHACPRS